jgi:two-component system chemotaxis sensor kinase CheA
VRIELEELDRLISSAHQLFGQTVSALDLVSRTLAADSRVELVNLDAQIRESLVRLEEQIIQLRLVPLERVMQRAIRAGRVAARVSGKEVAFVTAGEQLRIDKVVCDAVADPLLHLVRNAVDQGIESPAERAATGKVPAGTVRIEANSAGGRVRFRVSDDGRGIDPQVVSEAAAKLGIVDEGTLLTTEKSLRLIFRSGFSTSSQISSVSGRGVGLDIVESAIERVGGAVRVRTQVGQGTEFEIRLPVSLGVMRALVLSSGGYRYCVDAGLIVDRCLVPGGSQATSLSWHGETVPVVDLGKLLGHNTAHVKEDLRTLICQFNDEFDGTEIKRRQAVAVESIAGTEEVLVRSLGRHSALWPGIAGATELWDGTVALVLDLPLLLSMAPTK